jgi:hypothetical protein
VNLLVSELKNAAGRLLLAVYLTLAPSSVPAWRLSVAAPPALVLTVGEPVQWIFREGNR